MTKDWLRHFRMLAEVRENGRVTTRAQVDAIDASLDLLRREIHRNAQADGSTPFKYSVKRLRELNDAASSRGNGVTDDTGMDARQKLHMALMVMADDLIDALELKESLGQA